MPDERSGAPGSFAAPLDELLPSLSSDPGRAREFSVHIRRKPAKVEPDRSGDQCRIFILNQRLYERATR